jgi:hypothetical protein
MQLKLENVFPSQDGPYPCYDTVITAREIAIMYRTGFLHLEPDRLETIAKKLTVRMDKIDQWAEQLVSGEAYLGQLSWNFRKEDSVLDYDPETRMLTIGGGAATIPDSYHRHRAILKAVETAERRGRFNQERKFSLRIYHVPMSEENRIFYAMNRQYARYGSGT